MDLDSDRFAGVSTKDIHKLPTSWYREVSGYSGLSTGTVPVVDRLSPGLFPCVGLLANAETGENPAEQGVRAYLSGDFAQTALHQMQFFCDQFPGLAAAHHGYSL